MARRLEVSTAAATGIVDRLVARGHVERRPHAADRGVRSWCSPTSGRERGAWATCCRCSSALDRLDRAFTAEERAVVERYLRGAVAAFEQVLGEAA